MSWLDSIKAFFKSSLGTSGSPSAQLLEAFGTRTSSGLYISTKEAVGLSTVYSCINVLSESMANVPMNIYRRRGDYEEIAYDHPLYTLLRYQPNEWQSAYEFFERVMVDLLTEGNHYSYIDMTPAGVVVQLIPLVASRMRPVQVESGRIVYNFTGNDGVMSFRQDQVLHIRGKSYDGVLGVSPLGQVRELLGLAKATETYAGKLFSSGANMTGFFTLPSEMNPEAKKNFVDYLKTHHSGLQNSGRPGVLPSGVSFKETSIAPADAELIALKKMTSEEICGAFRVPPHLVGNLERATFSNIEEMGWQFVNYSLSPWGTRISQALRRDLLSRREKAFYYFEPDYAALTPADTESKLKFYASGIQWGYLSPNDVRRREKLPPREAGDVYLQPVNMQPSVAGSKPNAE